MDTVICGAVGRCPLGMIRAREICDAIFIPVNWAKLGVVDFLGCYFKTKKN